ncbi:MAG: hypothetical protein ACWGQW_03855 [bacterium]
MAVKPNDKWVIQPTYPSGCGEEITDGHVCPSPKNPKLIYVITDEEKAKSEAKRMNDIAAKSDLEIRFEAVRAVPFKHYRPIQLTKEDTDKMPPSIFLEDPGERVPEHDDDWGDPETRGVHVVARWYDEEKMFSFKDSNDALRYALRVHGRFLGKTGESYVIGIKNIEGAIVDTIQYKTLEEAQKEWKCD